MSAWGVADMLRELCIVSDTVDGIDDPILTVIAEEFDVPKDELVCEPITLLHDGNRTQVYHDPEGGK